MDELTLQRIQMAHPYLREELYCIYAEICVALENKDAYCRFAWVFRTPEQQNAMYAKGRSIKGSKVTNAKAWQSYHNYGMAVDIVIIYANGKKASWDVAKDWDGDGISDWMEIANIFQKHGWQWGIFNKHGNRYDLPHFQKTFGYKPEQLKKLVFEGNTLEDIYPKIKAYEAIT